MLELPKFEGRSNRYASGGQLITIHLGRQGQCKYEIRQESP